LLEIQGQTAMMIAGGLGAMLVDHVHFGSSFLIDAATYAIGFLLISTLPYHASHLEKPRGRPKSASSTWQKVPRAGVAPG